MSRPLPFISIVVPCRNEERFIGACLRSIIANDYPRDRFEVLVVDGMSTDDTRSIVRELSSADVDMQLLDNPKLITSAALNTGIAVAKGDLIAWMSSHNDYQANYLSLCAEYHRRYDADNVGGVIVTRPRDDGVIARSIANVLTHPFGVGPSHFRIAVAAPRWVDTVFGGCYRRDVFERVGLFNEKLVRGQDMEFNLRMRRAGLRTLLVPEIKSVYHARSRLTEFIRYNWINGVWTLKPFLFSQGMPVGVRHLVPMIFTATLLVLLVLCLGFGRSCIWLAAIVILYVICALLSAVQIALQKRDVAGGALSFLMFPVLHLSFGAACLVGALTVMADDSFWRGSGSSALLTG